MGRPTIYNREQDNIILAHPDANVVNRRLTEAGYQTLSPSAIKRRRHYLKTSTGAAVVDLTGRLAMSPEADYTSGFGKRLSRARAELALTVRQAAQAAEIPWTTWQALEDGHVMPAPDLCLRLADVLAVRPSLVFEWAGQVAPANVDAEYNAEILASWSDLMESVPESERAGLRQLLGKIADDPVVMRLLRVESGKT